jgi:predicted PurR-regulated permease PerM
MVNERQTLTTENMPYNRTTNWQRAFYVPLTILAWLALIVVGVWLLGHVAKTILTLVLSGLVAFALTPLVSWLSRWIPRPVAIALVYVLGFAIFLGLLGLLIITVAEQITTLVHHLPQYAHEAQRLQPQIIRLLKPFGVTQAGLNKAQHQLVSYLQGIGTTVAKDVLGIVAGVVGTIVEMVLVLILSVYLTANGPNIARTLRRETPRTQRWRMSLLIAIVDRVVGGYIRGTLTLAALIGFLVGIGMFVLGVPYAALLGVLAFFMEFIPIIGVIISGAVSVLVALFFQGWLKAILVLAYFVFVHVIEGDVIGPRIMGRAVGIHPATAIVALIAGTELFGFWGALFAAPLAGLAQTIGIVIWDELHGRDPHAVLHPPDKEGQDQEQPQEGTMVK